MLSDLKTKITLASLWTSFMFLYIYVDYFHLYMPGMLEDLRNGRVYKFEVSPVFLLIAMVSLTIPILMICLSVILPFKWNRLLNLTLAVIYIPYTLFNLAGEAWIHMYFAAAVETILLVLIIWNAWKWPRE